MTNLRIALGELELSSTLLETRRTTSDVVKADGTVLKDVPKNTKDHIHVISKTSDGAPVTILLRGGKPFKDTPTLDWRIYGETGELRLTSSGLAFHPDPKLEVHTFLTDEVEVVEIPSDSGFEELPAIARNTGRLYDAIARGDGAHLTTFEDALKRHRFIDQLLKYNV